MQAFPRLARELGTVLNNDPELRPVICTALCRLIETSCTLPSVPHADAEADTDADTAGTRVAANRAAVGPFAKNSLPILFNLYTTTAIDNRNYLLDTVRAWVAVADGALLSSLFATILRKLVEAPATATGNASAPAPQLVRHSMLDLALALAPVLDLPSLALLYRTLIPFLAVRCALASMLHRSVHAPDPAGRAALPR